MEFVVSVRLCLCVRGASWLPSLTLVLGECQGCPCDFLPQPELHLLGQGVSSPRASVLAPVAALGSERADLTLVVKGEDRGSSQGAAARLSEGPSPKTGSGGQGESCLRDTHSAVRHVHNTHSHANYNLLFP